MSQWLSKWPIPKTSGYITEVYGAVATMLIVLSLKVPEIKTEIKSVNLNLFKKDYSEEN